MAKANGKPGKMVRYISTEATTAGGAYAKPGEVFVTDADPLPEWQKIDADDAAAIVAADPMNNPGLDLTALDLPTLKAKAAAMNLNVGDAKTADDFIKIISAANEPAL